ncbi:isoprenylcysteine carboxylmethyltransferase family protein [candidate division WOR-3 bacterium]|nr:isoprenylcysteine carboxylmethyltransferase family protein [candidate division WOR-3 bacterium]
MKKWIFKHRGCLPVLPGLLLILFSKPYKETLIISLFLMALGELIRIFSVAYIGGRTRGSRTNAERLVTAGPYGIVRNPIYIGNFFIGMGFVSLFNLWLPWMFLIYIPLFFLEYKIIIDVEEEFLLAKFGDEYRRYRRDVPSIFPLPKRYNRDKINPDFIRALKSERDTFITIVLVYLLTYLVSFLKF